MASRNARRIGRTGALLATVGIAVAVIGALVWTVHTANLTAKARALDSADLTLGSSAVTRAAAHHAVVVGINYGSGSASPEAVEIALLELAGNVDALEELSTQVGGTEAQLVADLATEASLVATLIGNGGVDEARNVVEGPLQSAYESAVAELSRERAELVGALDSSAATASWMSTWLHVTLVMILPAAAFALGRHRERRRRRTERAELVGVIEAAEDRAGRTDRLLVEASHRIRTPLTSLYGLAEVLAQSKKVRGLERELASLVHAESAELYRIADDVLVTTQQRVGELRASAEIVALADVVDEAVKPARSAGLEVKVDCPEVWVLSDAAKVRQIIRNLVSNGAKHGAEPIFVEVGEAHGQVECVVVDHGEGLPSEIVPEDGRFGEGLGLPVAYGLSDLLGSSLTYRRSDGQTRFALAFAPEGPSQPSGAAKSGFTSERAPAGEPAGDPVSDWTDP